MSLWRQLARGLRALTARSTVDAELDEEVRDYFERAQADLVQQGLAPEEAARVVRRELGDQAKAREALRSYGWEKGVDETLHDFRQSIRRLRRSPGFTTVVALTLALGIGATTTVFSVVNAVMLKPLPYANPDRLVRISENVPAGELPGFDFALRRGINVAELDDWREAQTLSHVGVAGVSEGRILATDDRTVRLAGTPVSPALFAMRGIQPLLGRGLLPEEERPDADVIVLGEAAWREHFGADPGIVGRRVSLDGRALTVVGVMPAEFGSEAFWTPYVAPPAGTTSFANGYARLRDGVSLAAAAAEINALGLALRDISPEPGAAPRFEIVRELDQITAPVVPALRVLVVAVAAVLLIVCSNVGNLVLVRGTQRQREIAIRRSLGATRGRIVRLVLAESLTLAAVAGVLGAALAFGAVQLLKSIVIVDLPPLFRTGAAILPRAEEIAIDPVVLLFVGGLVVVTGTLFGVLPALRLSRFGEKGHSGTSQLSAAARNTRLGHVLATVQVAFAMALLIGAGLLLHSFLKLAAVDAGFDARGVLSFELVVPGDVTAERKLAVAEALAARLQAHPRVTAIGFADIPPLTGTGSWIMASFVPEGMTPAELQQAENALPFTQRTGTRTVSPGYLRALGARLVDGIWLAERPSPADFTVLVSRPYAERYFPGRRAVGATLASGDRTATIVGVVDDIHLGSLDRAPESIVFMEPGQQLAVQRAQTQSAPSLDFDQIFLTSGWVRAITFAARTDGDPLAIAADLRAIVRDIDPAFAVDGAIPMEAVLSGATTRPRFYASLLSAFGAIAAFVAIIGIYGVLAYLVSQRTREIGIRMALGAQQANVLKLVLRRGVTMIAIGLTAGVLGALALTRYIEAMLYGVTALDAATYVVVAAAFAAVALLASYVPARRATRVDPMTVLRHE